MGIVVLAMVMLYVFPEIATWLPSDPYDTPVGTGTELCVPEGGFQLDDAVELPSF